MLYSSKTNFFIKKNTINEDTKKQIVYKFKAENEYEKRRWVIRLNKEISSDNIEEIKIDIVNFINLKFRKLILKINFSKIMMKKEESKKLKKEF